MDFKSHLPTSIYIFSRSGDLSGQLPDCMSDSVDHIKLQHLVIGYEQLHKAGLLSSALSSKAAAQALARGMFETVFKVYNFKQNNSRYFYNTL